MKNIAKAGSFTLRLVDALSEPLCRKILFDLVCGPVCRYCEKPIPERHLKRFYSGKEVYCGFCDSRFFAVGGTILSHSKMNYMQMLKILIMSDLQVKTEQIATAVGVGRQTVLRWRRKLMEFKNG